MNEHDALRMARRTEQQQSLAERLAVLLNDMEDAGFDLKRSPTAFRLVDQQRVVSPLFVEWDPDDDGSGRWEL